MNKRQKLDEMVLRSRIRTQKAIREMALGWTGREATEINAPKPYRGERTEPIIIGDDNGTQ